MNGGERNLVRQWLEETESRAKEFSVLVPMRVQEKEQWLVPCYIATLQEIFRNLQFVIL